ncbi:hypothetical protein ACQPXH_28995 [Nocardia sp. CA-135953]|uniref:hypothetical protein n=1 Tax=Nocardia sp. CA-135953 TaxID=3239978 RepID=UPI003D9947D0
MAMVLPSGLNEVEMIAGLCAVTRSPIGSGDAGLLMSQTWKVSFTTVTDVIDREASPSASSIARTHRSPCTACTASSTNHAAIWLRSDADPDDRTRGAVVDAALRLFIRA